MLPQAYVCMVGGSLWDSRPDHWHVTHHVRQHVVYVTSLLVCDISIQFCVLCHCLLCAVHRELVTEDSNYYTTSTSFRQRHKITKWTSEGTVHVCVVCTCVCVVCTCHGACVVFSLQRQESSTELFLKLEQISPWWLCYCLNDPVKNWRCVCVCVCVKL